MDNKQSVEAIVLKTDELKKNKVNDEILIQINKLTLENEELKSKLNNFLLSSNLINDL